MNQPTESKRNGKVKKKKDFFMRVSSEFQLISQTLLFRINYNYNFKIPNMW